MPSIGELLGGAIGDKRNKNERRYEKKDNRQIIGKGGSGKPQHDKQPQGGNSRFGKGGGGFGAAPSKKKEKEKSQIATAPYNFISLPERILPSPLDDDRLRKALENSDKKAEREKAREIYGDYLEKAVLDGHIDFTLETLTPFFLGDGATTYAPTDVPMIPGSSIRGMVKNLFKIITLGAVHPNEDFTERHLYYRCMMEGRYEWGRDLHEFYKNRMTASDGKTKKTLPGFVIKTREGYAICPMKPGKTANRMLVKEYVGKFKKSIKYGDMKDVRVDWNGAAAYAISGSREDRQRTNKQKQPVGPKGLFSSMAAYKDYMATASNNDKKAVGKQFVKEYLLESVDFRKEARIPIDKNVVQEYIDDKNRRGVDLLRVTGEGEKYGAAKGEDIRRKCPDIGIPKDIELLAPCYYLPDGDGVAAFGHGQDFRIPYKNSVADIVPPKLQENTVDFADAMFGMMRAGDKAFWASRVFFEDARIVGDVFEDACIKRDVVYEAPHRAHPLSSPNPTSYQLYLKQPYKEGQREWGDLNHWDSEGARLRGYKLYWHNAKPDAWRASDKEIDAIDKDKNGKWKAPDKQLTRKITPVKKGTRFSARIRFSSLRPEELGALLMVFHMEQAKNIAYKIGKGKSIGLGSVRVADFSLSVNDEEQYRRLFTPDGGWNDPCVSVDDKKIQEYLTEFKEYVKGKEMENTWQHIMGELAAMLEWRDGWDEGKVSEQWEKATKEMRATYKYNDDKQEWETKFNEGFLRRDVLLPLREVLKRAGVTP